MDWDSGSPSGSCSDENDLLYEDTALSYLTGNEKDLPVKTSSTKGHIDSYYNKVSSKVRVSDPYVKASLSMKIRLGSYDGPRLASSAENAIKKHDRTIVNQRMRVRDKSDRATVEQVLDPRTRMILFKLLQRSIISSIDGCISTGKEANVYFAESASGPFAVKVYKTSILTFKDRDRYVSGEFRYRKGYCKHNPRKMVATWAEKEMRNLSRYKRGELYVIDVSQSVEHDHPHSLEFLRRDCANVNDFFRRNGVQVTSLRQLFKLIVDPTIDSEQPVGDFLARDEGTNPEDVAAMDQYFLSTFIPRKLEEVLNFEKDVLTAAATGTDPEVFYPVVTGMKEDLSGAKVLDQKRREQKDEELSEKNESSSDEEKLCASISSTDKRPRSESPNSRKERKAAVKEAQREKRKTKVPKHIKKRKQKLAKANAKP